MTLSIKNGRYAFLLRLDLMFFMSLWKEFQLFQILNKLSIRHLMKLILYENDVKLLKFKRDFAYWYLNWIHCNLPIFTANETITNLIWNINYPRDSLIYLKQVYTFQSDQIKFENLTSSLPLKRFIAHFLTTLNPRKPKVR